MILGHKIKLNPTEKDADYFRQAAGCARLAFNWGVARWQAVYAENKESENKKSISALELKKEFNSIKKPRFPFVYEVTKCACEGGFQDLGNALTNFFADCKKRKINSKLKVRFPKFKKKHKSQPRFYLANDKLKFKENEVYISGLGWVNLAESLRFEGKVMAGRVSFKNNQWWLSIQVEVAEQSIISESQEAVGIDLGIKILAVNQANQKEITFIGKKSKRFKTLAENQSQVKQVTFSSE